MHGGVSEEAGVLDFLEQLLPAQLVQGVGDQSHTFGLGAGIAAVDRLLGPLPALLEGLRIHVGELSSGALDLGQQTGGHGAAAGLVAQGLAQRPGDVLELGAIVVGGSVGAAGCAAGVAAWEAAGVEPERRAS